MSTSATAGAEERVLRRLAVSGARLLPAHGAGAAFAVFPGGDRRRRPTARAPRELVGALASAGAIARATGEGYVLTDAGRARLQRAAAPEAPYARQHQILAPRVLVEPGAAPIRRLVNVADDPLVRLGRSGGADGAAYLGVRALAAAERLRADQDRATRGARVTMDWEAGPASGGARGPGREPIAPGEAAARARGRVAQALAALGGELAMAVEAVVLRERGLDAVERAYGWPKRSAKLVLKIALGRLADHYRLPGAD